MLLIGDETALPALAGILEQLADHPDAPRVQAFIEVPEEADCLPLLCGLNAKVHWLPRASLGKRHGEGMTLAARELASLPPVNTRMVNVCSASLIARQTGRSLETGTFSGNQKLPVSLSHTSRSLSSSSLFQLMALTRSMSLILCRGTDIGAMMVVLSNRRLIVAAV